MADVPWFMLSPSPVSIIQYIILSWVVARYLPGSRLKRYVQAVFVVLFFVLIGDAVWAGLCAIRWIPLFPEDSWQIIFSFGRDILGAGVMFVMCGDLFLEKKLNFTRETEFWIFIMFMAQVLWFLEAPSPAFTDYTFAWRHGYPLEVVFGSYMISHFLMRIPLWLAIWSTLKREKGEQMSHEH